MGPREDALTAAHRRDLVVAANRPGDPRRRPQASRPLPRRPLPSGHALFTPGASEFRHVIERRAAAPLLYLYQLPRWVVPVALLVVLITGFAVPGWAGAVALLLLAAVLGALAYLSWPSLASRGRLLRGAAVAILIVLAIAQATR